MHSPVGALPLVLLHLQLHFVRTLGEQREAAGWLLGRLTGSVPGSVPGWVTWCEVQLTSSRTGAGLPAAGLRRATSSSLGRGPRVTAEWGGGRLGPGLETVPLPLVHPAPPLHQQGPVPSVRGDEAQSRRPPEGRCPPAGRWSGGLAPGAAGHRGGACRPWCSSCLEL